MGFVSNVNVVSDNIVAIQTTSSNMYKIEVVTDNMVAIDTVNANMGSIVTANDNMPSILTAVDSISDINIVSSNITAVGVVSTDIEAVKTNSNNIQLLSDISDISTSVVLVGDNMAKVVDVSDNMTKVIDVSDNMTKVVNVSDNALTISTVSDNMAKVVDVSDNMTKVIDVNDNLTIVATVSDNMIDVIKVASVDEEIKVTVDNLDSIIEASKVADIAQQAVNYKGDWSSDYTDGYLLNDSITYTDGYNYISKVDNNTTEPSSGVDTDYWHITLSFPEQVGNAGKFLSTDGNETEWADVVIPPATPINTPTITTPIDNDASFWGALIGNEFSITDIYSGVFDKSEWEILDVNDAIIDGGSSETTNFTPTKLEPATAYKAIVRYYSDNHISEWSEYVNFTTADEMIGTPVVSMDSTYSVYPTINISDYTVVGLTDTWLSTDYQVATDVDFTTLIVDANSTTNASGFQIDSLDINSTYYVRARYNGSEGAVSEWSSVVEYDTGLFAVEYTIPVAENELTDVGISITHDGSRAIDTAVYTVNATVDIGTVSIVDASLVWSLPDVSVDTTGTIEIWYEDSNGVVSTEVSKTLNIVAVNLVSDTAVQIVDFSVNNSIENWEI